MVERCLAKADIAGSNPVSRSMPRAFARGFLFVRDVEPAGFQLRGQGVRIPYVAPCMGSALSHKRKEVNNSLPFSFVPLAFAPAFSSRNGNRNDVALRCTSLTLRFALGRIPSPAPEITTGYVLSFFQLNPPSSE